MEIIATKGSHLVDGVWVTPEAPTTIPDADWPRFSGLDGVVQVATPSAPTPSTPSPSSPTLQSVQAELLVVAAEVKALEAVPPPSPVSSS